MGEPTLTITNVEILSAMLDIHWWLNDELYIWCNNQLSSTIDSNFHSAMNG